MLEQFANNYESTLNGAINNSVGSLVVTSATGAPSSGQFRLRIENEILLVTAVSGTTFTVTRGVEGTTAASHADGATLKLVLTKGALEQKRIDDVGAGAIASIPAAGATGRLYLPNEAPTLLRDNGSIYTPYGPLFKLSPVPSTGWSWVNQDGATIQTTDLGQLLHKEGAGITGISCRVRTMAVSAPTTLVAGFIWHGTISYSHVSILCRKNSSGEIMSFWLGLDNGSLRMEVIRYSSATTATGTAIAHEAYGFCWTVVWMKIVYDGTDLFFYISNDKIYWRLFYTEAKIYGFASGGPDEFGFSIGLAGSNVGVGMHVISWEES